MVVAVMHQEEISTVHRDALKMHQTRVIMAETELAEVDAALPQVDVDEADELLKRRRELQDKQAWLRTQEAELRRKADAEITRERLINANAKWVPLAEERAELIDQLDDMASAMLPILNALDLASEKQIDLLSGCRNLDALTGTSTESQARSANAMLRAYLIRRLELLRDFPAIAAGLPAADDKTYGQKAASQRRLFAVPKPTIGG